MNTQITRIEVPGWVGASPIPRNGLAQRLGVRLHPAEVTDAWYAADCPPVLDRSRISRRVHLQWRLSRLLRGV